jgi:hypothetical protein
MVRSSPARKDFARWRGENIQSDGYASSRDYGFVQILLLGGLVAAAGLVSFATFANLNSSKTAAHLEQQLLASIATSSSIARLERAITLPEDPIASTAFASGYALEIDDQAANLAINSEASKINFTTTNTSLVDNYVANLSLNAADRDAIATVRSTAAASDPAKALHDLYPYLLNVLSAEGIAGELTIYSDRPGINLRYASERVLAAIPDLSPTTVARILAERDDNPDMLTGLSAYAETGGQRFSLVATVTNPAGTRYVERRPIEITASGSVIFLAQEP